MLAFQQKRKPQWRVDNDLRDRFRLHRRQDRACVKCCPVDCIYEGGTLYIHPDECISCGICVSVCPTEAIHDAQELPPHEAVFAAINREFFGPDVSGSPGGADGVQPSACDHPMVAAYPARG